MNMIKAKQDLADQLDVQAPHNPIQRVAKQDLADLANIILELFHNVEIQNIYYADATDLTYYTGLHTLRIKSIISKYSKIVNHVFRGTIAYVPPMDKDFPKSQITYTSAR